MNLWSRFSVGLWPLLAVLAYLPVQAKNIEIRQLYIGVEKNRVPYVFFDDKQQAHGILVDRINSLCAKISAECHLIAGNFDDLVENVKSYQLTGLLVIDNFVYPELDQLALTEPLCTFQSAFVQKSSDKVRKKPDDFQGITIGVREGSTIHLRLLEDYGSMARLRPYPLLEAGVLDLVSGRINVLFGEAAFFKGRIQDTPLVNSGTPSGLIVFPLSKLELPSTNMTLALRESDADLLKDMNSVLQTNALPTCSELLNTVQQSGTQKTVGKP